MTETIVATATPPGQGGIGVIRLSGPAAQSIARRLTGRDRFTPRYAHFCRIHDESGEAVDEGLVLSFPGPNSFTGEDVVELQCHGSPVLLDIVIRNCIRHGARLATAGEFSKRAFLNGRLDLAQAEAIADLIESSNETAVRMAGRSLQGEFSRQIHQLVERLIRLRMYIEAAIDFPEEEIDFLADKRIEQELVTIDTDIQRILNKAQQGTLVREGMKLAIAGQPNAGKSSLLNRLAGNDVAIVTDIAGTTRDVLQHSIQIDGMPIHLVDTAGLRESEDVVEMEGIRRARLQLLQADHILWIYDPEKEPQHRKFAEAQLPENIAVTFVRNKIDQTGEVASYSEETAELALSAKTGQGIALLQQHLKNVMGYQGEQAGEFLARRRHLEAIDRACSHTSLATSALQEGAGEIAAEELRLAQNDLNEITGEFSSDDLLGRIFSSFCIGK